MKMKKNKKKKERGGSVGEEILFQKRNVVEVSLSKHFSKVLQLLLAFFRQLAGITVSHWMLRQSEFFLKSFVRKPSTKKQKPKISRKLIFFFEAEKVMMKMKKKKENSLQE